MNEEPQEWPYGDAEAYLSAQLRWDAYAEPWTHEDERARMAQRAALAAHPTSISAPAAVMTNY